MFPEMAFSVAIGLMLSLQVGLSDCGQRFVTAFMPNRFTVVGRLYLVNPGNRTALVCIWTPLLASTHPAYFYNSTSVAPLTSTIVTIPLSTAITKLSQEQKGILIYSTIRIVPQWRVDYSGSVDSYIIPPVSQLGTNYIVSHTKGGRQTSAYNIGFGVVATADNTLVNIRLQIIPSNTTMFYNNISYGIGECRNFTLNKYETLELESLAAGLLSIPLFNDLAGTQINASNPVLVIEQGGVVVIGYPTGTGVLGNTDAAIDVSVQNELVGSEYFFVPFNVMLGEQFIRIQAMYKNIIYQLRDESNALFTSGTLAPYRYIDILVFTNQSMVITTDSPAIVAIQFAERALNRPYEDFFWTDSAIMRCHPISMLTSEYAFSTMKSMDVHGAVNYLQLVVPTTDLGSLTINGELVNTTWVKYNSTPYSWSMVIIANTTVSFGFYKVKNNAGNSFFAYLLVSSSGEMAAQALRPTYPEDEPVINGQVGYFGLVAGNAMQLTSMQCMTAKSKSNCASYCLDNSDICAGTQYNVKTRSCCLLSETDMAGTRIYDNSTSIWEWTYVDFCTF